MSGKPAEIKLQSYQLPGAGLLRKPFSLKLFENEVCLPSRRVFFRTNSLSRDGCLWITNFRIVLLQYRWFGRPQLLEIPRNLISSIDWHSEKDSAWIDVKYHGQQGLECIQLRPPRRRYRNTPSSALLLNDLRQSFQHNHQSPAGNYPVPEIQEHMFLGSKIVLLLSVVGCLFLISDLALEYPAARDALHIYDSAPECHTLIATAQPGSSLKRCSLDNEKVARLYYRTSRSRDYYVVLQDSAGLTETAHLRNGENFYRAASSGDDVRVQRFMGEVTMIADGNLYAITYKHPHEKLNGIQTGLWIASVFLLLDLLLIWYLRNSLQW